MKRIKKAYAEFGRLMNEEQIYAQPGITFKDICAQIGVDEQALNKIIYEEMGMNGPEILESFQKLLNL